MFKEIKDGVLINLDYVFSIKANGNQLSFIDIDGRVLTVAEMKNEEEALEFLKELAKPSKRKK